MSNFRLSEVYTSVQGEGPRTGQMTQFVRFAGCNLRCPGWPCDTQHAIDPAKHRHEWKYVDVDHLFDEQILVHPEMVTLTGGEPFLQPKALLRDLVTRLAKVNFRVECFSNGTIKYPDWAIEHIDFIMDWKLLGSGERFDNRIETARLDNFTRLRVGSAVKFVVKHKHDLREALLTWQQIHAINPLVEFYVGRVWGEVTDQEIIDFVLEHELPWSLNVQVHKYLWDPEERGV